MNFLGYEIGFGSKGLVAKDAWPSGVSRTKRTPGFTPTGKPSKNNVTLQYSPGGSMFKKPTLDYQYSVSRDDFLEPEWDLNEIGKYATGESYFLRSVRIKTALMMKEDYSFVGLNQECLNYIRYRLKQISFSTNIPFEMLMWRTISDLVQYSNAYWVKVRKLGVKGTRAVIRKGKTKPTEPVVAYYYVSPETMTAVKPKQGDPVRYKQTIDDDDKYWAAEDVIHFSYDKRGGFLIGMPQVFPAIADIKLLRKLEENVAILIHKHLFPLFHYVVGTETQPAGRDSRTGESEVVVVRKAINEMPAEGSWVTDHRHQIKVMGAENKALRVETYLAHLNLEYFLV
jgi:hypothetical protein